MWGLVLSCCAQNGSYVYQPTPKTQRGPFFLRHTGIKGGQVMHILLQYTLGWERKERQQVYVSSWKMSIKNQKQFSSVRRQKKDQKKEERNLKNRDKCIEK